jgi:hypothetical protein
MPGRSEQGPIISILVGIDTPDITVLPEHGAQKATKDPKLTKYYSRYLDIIFSTMKKGIFLTKALNYL